MGSCSEGVMVPRLSMRGLTHEVEEIGVEVRRECQGVA